MNSELITELRPTSRSMQDFQQALRRIDEERHSQERLANHAGEERTRLLLSGTPAQLASSETALKKAHDTILALDELSAAIRVEFAEVRREEKSRELRDRLSKLQAPEQAEAFAIWWRKNYHKHATAIAEGLELEKAAQVAFRKAQSLRPEFEAIGEAFPDLHSPSSLAVGGALLSETLGGLVKLPGALGAPMVPSEAIEVIEKRVVQKYIFDNPYTPTHLCKTREEEIEERTTVYRPLRPDRPIW